MADERYNIILLTIDALRADHLSCHGYERETSPHLDRFAEQNIHFSRAYSPSSHTREAVPALLTGRYPDDAIDDQYYLDAPNIATYLRQVGYATGGFHSNPYLSRAYGYDRGFNDFDDDLHFSQHKVIALAQRFVDKLRNRHYARAEEINEQSLTWIDSLDEEPFFLWNHYMDIHGPYQPPGNTSISQMEVQELYQKCLTTPTKITNEEHELLQDAYDAEIEYLDTHIQDFLDRLDGQGIFDNSLVIIVADHGDAFGEHGYYGHPRFLHEELLHVPLIISHPNQVRDTVDHPVSTVGIVPTILESLREDHGHLTQKSILMPAGDVNETPEIVFASATGEDDKSDRRRFACWEDHKKVIMERSIDNGSVVSVSGFDLADDPEEQQPITEFRGAFEQLRQEVEGFSSHQLSTRGTSVENEGNAEVEDRLKALGYK